MMPRTTSPENSGTTIFLLKYSTINKFICRYDCTFPLQLMSVCKERPAILSPPLDAIGLEPVDHTHAMSRGGSGHRRPSSALPPSRQASIGLLGFTPSALGKSGAKNLFSMSNLSTIGNWLLMLKLWCKSVSHTYSPCLESGHTACKIWSWTYKLITDLAGLDRVVFVEGYLELTAVFGMFKNEKGGEVREW